MPTPATGGQAHEALHLQFISLTALGPGLGGGGGDHSSRAVLRLLRPRLQIGFLCLICHSALRGIQSKPLMGNRGRVNLLLSPVPLA